MGHLHRRLIAFDLDGTLVDSLRDLTTAANRLIVELGGASLPDDAVARMVGEGARVLVARALRAAGLAHDGEDERLPHRLGRFLEIYDQHLLDHTRPYPGIEDVLAAARPHARLAVLTNKPGRATNTILEGLRLRRYFDDVIGGDGEWPRKPDPSSLQYLMLRADAPAARTLLVGDSLIDYETAARAGARCCLAAYGFGFPSVTADRVRSGDLLVRHATELLPIVAAFARDEPPASESYQ